LPSASAKTGLLAAGAAIGLCVSWILLASGVIKRSYESSGAEASSEQQGESGEARFDHRREVCREIVFLLPILACSAGVYCVGRAVPGAWSWWVDFAQRPAVAGLLGGMWGYFVGAGIIWGTRILGTLGFGKEAMGLGDVHLMGAAGTFVGGVMVVAAFFIAPFFGLAWAGFQMFFKKTRQIPYGPFLSMGIFAVMILHDWILNYLSFIFYG
ncbi:MAG: A24 family peptidase, partial [Planctomycetota bacterium]|jgi:leader peptidase (prepilin peptidase)/N-methyltransferase